MHVCLCCSQPSALAFLSLLGAMTKSPDRDVGIRRLLCLTFILLQPVQSMKPSPRHRCCDGVVRFGLLAYDYEPIVILCSAVAICVTLPISGDLDLVVELSLPRQACLHFEYGYGASDCAWCLGLQVPRLETC